MDNLVVVQKSKEIAHTVTSSGAFRRFVDVSGRVARLVGLVLYVTALWTVKISWAITKFIAVVFFELSKYVYGIWKEREEEQAAIRRSAYRYRKVREEVERQDRPWWL